ncbi:hypothetical protein [Siminovitchia acidinfaciens]|nr:hypothetical protein [Siminovitchia acidinfaciens]
MNKRLVISIKQLIKRMMGSKLTGGIGDTPNGRGVCYNDAFAR